MKTTLTIKRDYISDEVVNALQSNFKLFTIDVIEDGEIYEIKFYPNTKSINDLRSKVTKVLENKNKTNELTADLLTSSIMTSLAFGYAKIYAVLMQHISSEVIESLFDNKVEALENLLDITEEIKNYEQEFGSLYDNTKR